MKIAILFLGMATIALAGDSQTVNFHSPGFPPSHMDAAARLVADWGTLGVKLTGPGVKDATPVVKAIKLDGVIPAARAVAKRGAVSLTLTAYRSPVWPSGLDVLTACVEETQGRPAKVTLALDLPAKVRVGLNTVKLGSRVVVALPSRESTGVAPREWGYWDEGSALPGWAKPQGVCDPSFRNIRAGMGGVALVYRFSVPRKSAVNVVLGFCESHWAEAGRRPLLCTVEGAPRQQVDPIAKWGRHQPGALLFAARDENGDGKLDVTVRAARDAKDKNPILNAIWLFPAGRAPDLKQVISGRLNSAATRQVDVGGPGDQSLYPAGNVEYHLSLPARGAQDLTFLVACQNTSAPLPDKTAWTTATLRRAAIEVWRDWREH